MDRIMCHHLMFGGSYRSLEYNANEVVNRTPNASIKVPSTKYKIKKFLEPIFKSEIFIKCNRCSDYVPSLKSNTTCQLCQSSIRTTNSDYFIYIPVKQQIEHKLKLNLNEILAYNSTVHLQNNEIKDIHNAEAFKSAQKMYPKHFILPLIVNTARG